VDNVKSSQKAKGDRVKSLEKPPNPIPKCTTRRPVPLVVGLGDLSPDMWGRGSRRSASHLTHEPHKHHRLLIITRIAPRHKPVSRPGLSTARRIARVGCRAMPTWQGTCSRPYTWAVTPARGREKSRGPSNQPLNSASYRGGYAKQVPNRAPTLYVHALTSPTVRDARTHTAYDIPTADTHCAPIRPMHSISRVTPES
jgi:hypothetical protein